jgi:hypothetical protein
MLVDVIVNTEMSGLQCYGLLGSDTVRFGRYLTTFMFSVEGVLTLKVEAAGCCKPRGVVFQNTHCCEDINFRTLSVFPAGKRGARV